MVVILAILENQLGKLLIWVQGGIGAKPRLGGVELEEGGGGEGEGAEVKEAGGIGAKPRSGGEVWGVVVEGGGGSRRYRGLDTTRGSRRGRYMFEWEESGLFPMSGGRCTGTIQKFLIFKSFWGQEGQFVDLIVLTPKKGKVSFTF